MTSPPPTSATAPLPHAEEEAGGGGGVASAARLDLSAAEQLDADAAEDTAERNTTLGSSLFLEQSEAWGISGATNTKILHEVDWEETLRRDAGKTMAQRGYLEIYQGGASFIPASKNVNEPLTIKFDDKNTSFKHAPELVQQALRDGMIAEVLLGCVYRRGP